jgi:hypothetical protein
MQTYIVPVPGWPNQSVQLNLSDFRAVPDTTLDAGWQLLDEQRNVNASGRIQLTTEQYEKWGAGSDETYLTDAFAQNLGLTPTKPVPPPITV